MAHNTEVVQWVKLSNGQHAVCIRCCGDSGTDHWHVMAAMTPDGQPVDQDRALANMQAQHVYVAQQHESMRQASAKMLAGAGATMEHP